MSLKSKQVRADFFTKEARRKGYPARSVFKLQEIDKKFKLFSRPLKAKQVVDLGCSPGSWSMYAAEKVGKNGSVFGVDLKPLSQTTKFAPQIKSVVADINDWRKEAPGELTGNCTHVISDMAPNTTGNAFVDGVASVDLCHMALDVAEKLLKPRGNVVLKVFDCSEKQEIEERIQQRFKQLKRFKPKSTRDFSREYFLVGIDFVPTGPEPDAALRSPTESHLATTPE